VNHIARLSPDRNDSTLDGRGQARHRHRLSAEQRIERAADLASGVQHLHPSIKDSAALYAVLPLQVSERLKVRAQREVEWREAECRWRAQEEAERANAEAEILVDTWRSIAPESREVAIRLLGPGAVWDALARVVA
jgi:hypothetical protein